LILVTAITTTVIAVIAVIASATASTAEPLQQSPSPTPLLTTDQFFTLVGIGVTLIITIVGAAYRIGRKLKSVEKDIESLKNQINEIKSTIDKHASKEQVNNIRDDIKEIRRWFVNIIPLLARDVKKDIKQEIEERVVEEEGGKQEEK
jgi:peptidoglycan hydrolase CwlO-like protein